MVYGQRDNDSQAGVRSVRLLIHNSNILAQDPVEDTDRITANGAIFYKATMPGWEIIDTALPDDFGVDNYQYSDGRLQAVTRAEEVPDEIDSIAAIIVLEQSGFGAAYESWVTSNERTRIEKETAARRGRWRRDNALLISAANAIGITSEQLDQMFIAASKINL